MHFRENPLLDLADEITPFARLHLPGPLREVAPMTPVAGRPQPVHVLYRPVFSSPITKPALSEHYPGFVFSGDSGCIRRTVCAVWRKMGKPPIFIIGGMGN